MARPLAQLTASEIRQRLAELDKHIADFGRRDMDAELGAVLRGGGNVDALEAAQLDAERIARRLRVEKSALTEELPNAVRREGQAQLVVLTKAHGELAQHARERRDEMVSAWEALETAIQSWNDVQDQATSLTSQAVTIARESGAAVTGLGTFTSTDLCRIIRMMGEAYNGRRVRDPEAGMATYLGTFAVDLG